MYSSTHSLTLALDGGEWSTSRSGRFTSRARAPGIHWMGGRVDPRAVLDSVSLIHNTTAFSYHKSVSLIRITITFFHRTSVSLIHIIATFFHRISVPPNAHHNSVLPSFVCFPNTDHNNVFPSYVCIPNTRHDRVLPSISRSSNWFLFPYDCCAF
jgi:hypothetical protein